MLIGQEVFGNEVFGGEIEGNPIFPPVSFGENSCVGISNQVENLSISDQVENVSISKVCLGDF